MRRISALTQDLSAALSSALIRVAVGLTPKASQLIIVHSAPDLEDGALSLLHELQRRGHEPQLLLEDDPSGSALSRLAPRVRASSKNSIRGKFLYSRAKYIFTTHGPYSRHGRIRRQTVVNIWHGEALGKPVGLRDNEKAFETTWTTALSNVGAAFRCSEFNMPPKRVLVVGAPRNDRLLNASYNDIRDQMSQAQQRTLAVWLPTYRQRDASRRSGRVDGTAQVTALPFSLPDLMNLQAWLDKSSVDIVAKPHPTALEQGSKLGAIKFIDANWLEDRGLTLYEMLAGSDVLITDASSVWIDYLLLDRPIVFAFPDIRQYQDTRGLNLEPYEDWIPGPVVRSIHELISELQQVAAGDDRFADERRRATRRFHKYHDSHSTVRLLERIGL